MKNYTITVNGTAYDVTVEENTGVASAPVAKAVPKAASAAPAPVFVPATPALAPQAPVGVAGAVTITATVPGKVCKVEAPAGQAVKAGDTVIIIEAMKMEIPIVAPQDGTIASIDVVAGAAIESGDLLATMN